jgi:hypothetical protein
MIHESMAATKNFFCHLVCWSKVNLDNKILRASVLFLATSFSIKKGSNLVQIVSLIVMRGDRKYQACCSPRQPKFIKESIEGQYSLLG